MLEAYDRCERHCGRRMRAERRKENKEKDTQLPCWCPAQWSRAGRVTAFYTLSQLLSENSCGTQIAQIKTTTGQFVI